MYFNYLRVKVEVNILFIIIIILVFLNGMWNWFEIGCYDGFEYVLNLIKLIFWVI